jgi:GNAT superfamily N-acetyltransferase
VERVSSKGVPARMDLFLEIDDGIKEAWTVELVELHTPDEPGGYLKISYIPEEKLQRYFPTAFEYAVRERGKYLRISQLLDKGEENWSRDDYETALNGSQDWLPYGREAELRELYQRMSLDQIQDEWARHKQEIASAHQSEYEEFCDGQLDKPHVDFIRVYDENDDDAYQGSVRKKRKTRSDLRRQGLGVLMYETAALWAQARGMRFYASGVQSPEAEATWAAMERRGLVRKEGKRKYLDAEKLLRESPEIALSF